MKKLLIFVGGFIVGAYGMYSYVVGTAAKAIIKENKAEEETID